MIATEVPRDAVDQLLRLLRRRSRTHAALDALVRWGLWCGTVWAALWFVPAWHGRWAALLLVVPFLAALRSGLRASRGRAVLHAEQRLDLHDALRTWLGQDLAAGWDQCLLAQLAGELRGKDLARALPRAQVGRERVLLFALVLLLLVRFGLPDFLGSRGPAGLAGQATTGGTGAGDGAAGGSGAADGPQQPGLGTPPPAGAGGARPPRTSPPDEGPRQPPGSLPEAEHHVDAFVPPAFDRDGPRTEREIEAVERPVGAVPPPRAGATGGSADGPDAPLPELQPAVEEAIARRRIDAAEAGFMRRYFARLREVRR